MCMAKYYWKDAETTEMLMFLNIYQYFKVGGWPQNMKWGFILKSFEGSGCIFHNSFAIQSTFVMCTTNNTVLMGSKCRTYKQYTKY